MQIALVTVAQNRRPGHEDPTPARLRASSALPQASHSKWGTNVLMLSGLARSPFAVTAYASFRPVSFAAAAATNTGAACVVSAAGYPASSPMPSASAG